MQRRRLMFDGHTVVVVEEELPPPAAEEVQVRTEWTQVSIGTEVAHIEDARAADERDTLTLGYSLVGRIEQVGAQVTHLQPGDRVLSLAPHASRVNVPASPAQTVPVPEGLSPDLATLGVLGSVAYHIVQRAAPRVLEPTAVLGQGVVGSLVAQIIRRCGVRPLIVLDLEPARLKQAQALGADHAIDASEHGLVEHVREITADEGVSLCIEAAASAAAFQTAIDVLRLHGRLVITSTVFEPVPFHISRDLIRRELTLLGAHQPKCPLERNPYHLWTQAGNRTAALEDIRDGRLMVEHLISHRLDPDAATETYERLCARDRAYVGVLFDWRHG